MISCILLAAGSSTRFGSPKPLATIGEQTVLEFILQKLLETKVSEIILVLGADADAIARYIPKCSRIKPVLNKNYALGQTSSFKTGLADVAPGTKGVLLLPVDTPLVKTETINLLIDTFSKNLPLILIPTFQGRHGHSPVFSEKLFDEFNNLKDEEPLFGIQRAHKTDILRFPVADKGVIQSFNTKEEFNKIIDS